MVNADETIRQRKALISLYQSPKWTKKVNLMGPDQVSAIYLRLKEQNKIKT